MNYKTITDALNKVAQEVNAIRLLTFNNYAEEQYVPPTPMSLDELKSLLLSDEWPVAAPPDMIYQENENDKLERASLILGTYLPQLNGSKFLDFGCGEGHVVKLANSSLSVGYDIKKSSNWENGKNKIFTDDLNVVKENGPYDAILLYDVLDHADNILEVMKSVRSLCKSNTKVYIHCHPFFGRHGGHICDKLNKAFVHLFLTPNELKEMGIELEGRWTEHPKNEYYNAFFKNGFNILSHETFKEEIEDFFDKIIQRRFAYSNSMSHMLGYRMMETHLDFVLTPGINNKIDISMGEWNHFVGTQHPKTFKMYLNKTSDGGRWEYKDKKMFLYWGNDFSVVELNNLGTKYKGTNQDNNPVIGCISV